MKTSGSATLTRLASDARLVVAARQTGADSVIGRLPNGYDTQLCKWLWNGYELSAGEWQKVALARVPYSDAALRVLDEPANFLDAESEERIRTLIVNRRARQANSRRSAGDRSFLPSK